MFRYGIPQKRMISLRFDAKLAMSLSFRSYRRSLATMIGALALISTTPGCHRQFYRKQADLEVNAILDEKSSHVARPPNIAIRTDIDPRSRMFNPFDLDFQPMPIDDPASYQYMQCVDERRGYPLWEAAGITNTTENPDWWKHLPLDEDGVLVLNQENAVQIARLHSTQYQEQIEALYFAALDVVAQRFQFETQFFGGADTALSTRSGGPTSFGLGDRNMALRRGFVNGTDLVVNMANSIVWDLTGGSSVRTSSSLLDFSLVQPLLRGAGRDKVMEGLTQSERSLLASIRGFERFRRSFYLNVTVGSPTARIAQSSVNGIGSPNGNFGGAGGYLGLLQNQLRIRNTEENIARQTENLLLLEETLIELLTTIPDTPDRIVSQRLQVAQTRAALLRGQSSLVSQQASYQRSVDQFLQTLGLPPYICVKLDDPILNRFELIDRTLLTRREELSSLRSKVGEINEAILATAEIKLDEVTGLPVSNITWTDEVSESLKRLAKEIQPLEAFTKGIIENDLKIISKDIEALQEALPVRRKQTEKLSKIYNIEKQSICGLLNLSEIDESIFEMDRLGGLTDELLGEYASLKERLTKYQSRIRTLQKSFDDLQETGAEADPAALAQRLRDEIILGSQDLVAELGDDVLLLQLIQARARTESVLLPEIDLTPELAFEVAKNNRRDWANARASLVDSWRQIEVVANDLESFLDIVVSGGVGNTDVNGSLSKSGSLNLGLQWDAPITRLLERNRYRRELIRYEQTKRQYYIYEDSIWRLLRSEVRQLQANRLRFELGRQAVSIAADQIDLNTDIRILSDVRGGRTGPTAARDAIEALDTLLSAQNGLLDIFVSYEVLRRNLDLDMGTMELTPEGLWLDPGTIYAEDLLSLPGTSAGGMLENGCKDCGIRYNPLPSAETNSPLETNAKESSVLESRIPEQPRNGKAKIETRILPVTLVEEVEPHNANAYLTQSAYQSHQTLTQAARKDTLALNNPVEESEREVQPLILEPTSWFTIE